MAHTPTPPKPDTKETKLDTGLFGTAKINPDDYSPSTNSNFYKRTKYALAGLIHVLVRQVTTRSLIVMTVIGFALAAWLGISVIAWAILVLAIGINWVAEMINTAIEATVNLATQGEIHPMAKVAKDVAAATTLFAFLLALTVALILFVPALMGRFG